MKEMSERTPPTHSRPTSLPPMAVRLILARLRGVRELCSAVREGGSERRRCRVLGNSQQRSQAFQAKNADASSYKIDCRSERASEDSGTVCK